MANQTLRYGLAVAALSLCAASSHASVITYGDFSSTAGLTLAGNAGTATTSDGHVLRLTPASGSQHGAAYSTSPITLGTNATFSTTFHFRFTQAGGIDPADGITFVLAASPTGLGGSGGGIGYSGVSHSLAIEFDTYNNGYSSNHVGIDTGGSLTDTARSNVYGIGTCVFSGYTQDGCMSNGHLWTATIGYDGSKLTAQLSDPNESSAFTAIDSYSINIASILGTNSAYVGFTSGTGSGYENHDITDWQFANTTQLSPGAHTDAVPAPPTTALMILGVAGLGLARRRSA